MSIKIKISYETEEEATAILALLKPIAGCFKVKKSMGTSPYKHIYFTPKKRRNCAE